MPQPFALAAELPKRLTGHEECRLLEQVLASGRASPTLRLRLGQLYNRLDRFDESIALLDAATAPADYHTAQALITALFARRGAGDDARALALAEHTYGLAGNDRQRAYALSEQGKAQLRQGAITPALALLHRALDHDPSNPGALRRLAGEYLELGRPDQALALIDGLRALGVANSQMLGSATQALAQRGELVAARALADLPGHLLCETLAPPPGWADHATFNAALTAELLDSPGLRDGRHGTASVFSLRVDEPATARTPALRALQDAIVARVITLVAGQHGDHPWLAIRPASAHLRMWCVMTDAPGWERWHMHPLGWATGGYYVAVPDAVVAGTGPAGCLEFGLPEHRIGAAAAAAYGSTLLRPAPGMLTLFPSHAYHRTHPHGAAGLRICLAFDLLPA